MKDKLDMKLVMAGMTVIISLTKLIIQHRGQVRKKNV